MKASNKKIVAVLGGSKINDSTYNKAYQVGKIIAEKGCILICGGLGGVMEAAAKGASDIGGTTIGVLPGTNKKDCNKWINIPIVTGIGEARNVIIARTCDIAVAIDGEYGTLSEIAFCIKFGKTVLGIETHSIKGVRMLSNVEDVAVFL